jgi:hypothetical protein
VTPRPNGCSRVRIYETGFLDIVSRDQRLSEIQRGLNQLDEMLTEAVHLRKRTRQAIIVVHGIGEQLPSQTLRSFTNGVFTRGSGSSGRYVKPDYNSSLFEMKMVRIGADKKQGIPPTDVYELYWAHLIRDTTLGQVYSWLLRLLLAPKNNIPPALRKHFWGIRALLVVVGVAIGWFILYSRTSHPSHPAVPDAPSPAGALWTVAMTAALLAAVPTLVWATMRLLEKRFLLGFLGDAARYLEPLPGNVERRQAIRKAGVDLLNALHDSGDYCRIIVFGHSLGSVIAYDILSLSWIQLCRKRTVREETLRSKALMRLEDLLNPRDDRVEPKLCADEIAAMQHEAWKEYQRNGFRWLVTDFVTAGSPLASARLLLNLDKHTSFDSLVADRSFPTCPPQTEPKRAPKPGRTRQRFTFTHAYRGIGKHDGGSVQIPHHAALFALIRWTNLYFPMRGFVRGDPIGGPLGPTLGCWIRDVELPHPGGGFLGFAHTMYWQRRGDWAHIHRLRKALMLPFHRSFDDLASELREEGEYEDDDEYADHEPFGQ